MSNQGKRQPHVRRLFPAPDNAHQLLGTCDTACVPLLRYSSETNAVSVVSEGDDNAQPVQLPFPAIDIAWCPFKVGKENTSCATACHGQPIQLWDIEDAELRASYTARNDSDYHVHPHALCWFTEATRQHWIAGGYGGFEDATQVRVYDVLMEGNSPIWAYRPKCSRRGMVSALHDCQWNGTTSLLAVGFHNTPSVHLLDCRNRCPVAELHGLRQGVQSIRSAAEDPFHVYAGGSKGDSRIACWDLRSPCTPLFTLERTTSTNQIFEFQLLPGHAASYPRADENLRRLVTTSSLGGVILYEWRAGDAPVENQGQHLCASTGPTSGLAAVGPDTVVVSTGCRTYPLSSCSPLATASCSAKATEAAAAATERDKWAPCFPTYKRPRSPLRSDSDDEADESAKRSAGVTSKTICRSPTEATNVAVISLKR